MPIEGDWDIEKATVEYLEAEKAVSWRVFEGGFAAHNKLKYDMNVFRM